MQDEERKAAHHELMGGKLHVYKRENSQYWQCSTYLEGRNRRVSTKEESLQHAKDFAEDWYLELKGKSRAGQLRDGKTFREAAKQFELEYEVITEGQRSKSYVQAQKDCIRVHLNPFFGDMVSRRLRRGKCRSTASIGIKIPVSGRARSPKRQNPLRAARCIRRSSRSAMF